MLALSEYRSLDAMALALGVRNRDFTNEEEQPAPSNKQKKSTLFLML